MFTQQEIDHIRSTVTEITGFPFDSLEIAVEEGPGIAVTEEGGRFFLRAESKSALARAWPRRKPPAGPRSPFRKPSTSSPADPIWISHGTAS